VLLKHSLETQENFKAKQGFFLCLFKEKKPIGKFVLSPTVKLVDYILKKRKIGLNLHPKVTISQKPNN